ncbi:unnamed protein product [Paramecium sonneborni]|uniref:Uncharacterized protein n=1 Tax=Paramecium sonneborni TaxID=65129 RepID=A0A8S1RUY5_9CILI|nr:unnamed protein product [Paramecium sonneborni]
MSNTSKLMPNNHFLAYEDAKAKCKEKYLKFKYLNLHIKEYTDFSNLQVDMKLCKQMYDKYSECFNVNKPAAYQGKQRE